MSKTRVALVVPNLLPGGAEKSAINIVNSLNQNYDADLVCLENNTKFDFYDKDNTIFLSNFSNKEFFFSKFFNFFLQIKEFNNLIQERQYDKIIFFLIIL